MKHNNEICEVIRSENVVFNTDWITTYGFVGDANVSVSELDVAETLKMDTSPFMVVWLKNIERLCQMFERAYDNRDFTLLDVGCGSGISTMFFNQNYRFKRFCGFDFSPKLIRLASRNYDIASKNGFDMSSTAFSVADAKVIKLPNERHAVFMFNPFGWETMKMFLSNNADMLRDTKSVLLYANDICIEELLESGGGVIERDEFFNLSLVSFG